MCFYRSVLTRLPTALWTTEHLSLRASVSAHRGSFLVAELGPDVDPFVLHLFAALAEKERAMISARTRSALAAAKARKVVPGGLKLHESRVRGVAALKG
jgi:DNA invertase Pin-like site-specific DNA recombinase